MRTRAGTLRVHVQRQAHVCVSREMRESTTHALTSRVIWTWIGQAGFDIDTKCSQAHASPMEAERIKSCQTNCAEMARPDNLSKFIANAAGSSALLIASFHGNVPPVRLRVPQHRYRPACRWL